MNAIPIYPFRRSSPFAPSAEFDELRAAAPLSRVRLWDGSEAWLVTRYDDVRAVLLDPRFSESPKAVGYSMLSPARAALLSSDTFISHVQGAEHSVLRRVLSRELSVKRVEALREPTRALVHRLIDEMVATGDPLDFIEHFALALPMHVITTMLGVPYEDTKFFEENSIRRVSLDLPPHVPVEATRELAAYFDAILRRKERESDDGDDTLSRLARDHVLPGTITHAQAVNLAYTLVQAGHETTGNQIALGTLMLLQDHEQRRTLVADPGLVKGAVEEMLRYFTIVQFGMARAALEDVEVGGEVIRKGDGVFVMLVSANHDPEAFECPHRFDITRAERNHVAFSFGIHQCAGQQLARIELQEIFSILFQRLPELRLAVPFEDLKFRHNTMNFGVERLPVIW